MKKLLSTTIQSTRFGLPLFTMAFLFIGCYSQAQQKTNKSKEISSIAKDLMVGEFKAGLKSSPDAQLVDVRTPEETAQGVIPGAIKINLHDADFEHKIMKLDKTKPVYVYCRSGARSGNAMSIMKKAGFREVYNLSGGILAWQQSGGEVVK